MQSLSTYRGLPTYRGWLGQLQQKVGLQQAAAARLVDDIRRQADALQECGSARLSTRFSALRDRVAGGEPVTSRELVAAAFALTVEAVRRATGKTLYDVQLTGGSVLAGGAIAEIQTGEGKTIVASLPAALHALNGRGVHVATTNDYLARRDRDELKTAYELLGLSAGLLQPADSAAEKRAAYACDITYGPGYEFGFDFLRDQLQLRSRRSQPLGAECLQRLRGHQPATEPLVQRGHAFWIVDEADSVLIDEATTPLIVSGSSTVATEASVYRFAREAACRLREDRDFESRSARIIALTEAGSTAVHKAFKSCPDGRLARPWKLLIEHALVAEYALRRDVDYVVQEGHVMIVDPHTGRIHRERQWRDGLHQAVEVKEGLRPSSEKQTQASITRQRYCQRYERVCGMTGTAADAETDFRDFYGLPVVSVPLHRPCLRQTLPARFFPSQSSKFRQIADDVQQRHSRGQPVLIGTRSIRDSRLLSQLLRSVEVPHTILNGLQDANEAAVVGQAGTSRAVTVATNMAGRGTDIRLDNEARRAGGLHVVASEHHPSRRVDRQLVGRAARQGDPGSCQFWASAEDDYFQQEAPELAARLEQIASDGVSSTELEKEVARLQARSEQCSLHARRQLVAHDEWLESVKATLARRT